MGSIKSSTLISQLRPAKLAWFIGLVAIVVSAICLAPAGPFVDGRDFGIATLYTFLATLTLCFALLNAHAPHTVAHHGGVGLLAGLLTGGIFFLGAKGAPIFILFGAFPGTAFGLMIGIGRRLAGRGCVTAEAASRAESGGDIDANGE